MTTRHGKVLELNDLVLSLTAAKHGLKRHAGYKSTILQTVKAGLGADIHRRLNMEVRGAFESNDS